MKVVAFLPVKGSSERIENKNIRLLDGKPLFMHTLEKLVACEFIDEVYLDSECEEIFQIASEVDCKFFRRDKAFASNKTDGHELFYNEIKDIDADIYIQILATSPFIEPETIREGTEVLKTSTTFDSAVLVKKDKLYLWQDNQPLYGKGRIPNSIDLPDTIIETMGLYLVKKDAAHRNRMRFGDNTYFIEAKPIEAIDVNFPEDFELAGFIAAGKREKERQLLKNLRNHLTTSMLSDILADLDLTGVIEGLKPNIHGAKILGRAKTLKLRALKDGEDFRGIYDALESYSTIIPNDIIMVQNEVAHLAYFGELNANLAIRAGATGVIIGGMTRDTREVRDLGLPVFSMGSTCMDVRKKATLDSINKRIQLFGIEISPGDLIFADNDGVVVIPRKFEQVVLKRAFEILNKEKTILLNITLGMDAKDLVEKSGAF
jgi:regulator of RNase E activity RraA/CMP-N-acetylneuraminic acid synthetase